MAIIGVMAATVAGATIWLLLSDPVKGADAAGAMFKGDPGPFMQAIGAVIYDALKGLFKYSVAFVDQRKNAERTNAPRVFDKRSY